MYQSITSWKATAFLLLLVLAPAAARAEEALTAHAIQPAEEPTKPNFIVVFVDDMGYADVGCFGAEVIRTPYIDQMAEEGMRFTSFYAQPLCGASRTAIMTGCYPDRVAQHNNRYEVHPVVHSQEIMISEILKEQGYATGCFGKWDMATHSQSRFVPHLMPNHQGFDYFFGTPSSNDNAVHLFRNEERLERGADMSLVTQRYTDEAIGFIERHQEEPFFIYLPHTMPHTRLAASEEFAGNSERGIYGDVVEEIDANVGRLIETLQRLDLTDNTYMVFTSDNGPWLAKNRQFQDGVLPSDHGGSAGPLRGGKGSTWEGGIRVPCVWWAPGRIPAGTTCESLTATIDVLPTLAQLAGGTVPTDRVIDGHDISPILAGDFDQADEDRVFYYYSRGYLQAVRQGPWKLHLANREPGQYRIPNRRNSQNHADDNHNLSEPLLYHLGNDLGEQTDVAAENPEVVARMVALGEAARADIGDHDLQGENARRFD